MSNSSWNCIEKLDFGIGKIGNISEMGRDNSRVERLYKVANELATSPSFSIFRRHLKTHFFPKY